MIASNRCKSPKFIKQQPLLQGPPSSSQRKGTPDMTGQELEIVITKHEMQRLERKESFGTEAFGSQETE